jgi:hypothetical protein
MLEMFRSKLTVDPEVAGFGDAVSEPFAVTVSVPAIGTVAGVGLGERRRARRGLGGDGHARTTESDGGGDRGGLAAKPEVHHDLLPASVRRDRGDH